MVVLFDMTVCDVNGVEYFKVKNCSCMYYTDTEYSNLRTLFNEVKSEFAGSSSRIYMLNSVLFASDYYLWQNNNLDVNYTFLPYIRDTQVTQDYFNKMQSYSPEIRRPFRPMLDEIPISSETTVAHVHEFYLKSTTGNIYGPFTYTVGTERAREQWSIPYGVSYGSGYPGVGIPILSYDNNILTDTGKVYNYRFGGYNSISSGYECYKDRDVFCVDDRPMIENEWTRFLNNTEKRILEPTRDPFPFEDKSETGGGGGTGDYPYDIIPRATYDSLDEVKRGYINRGFVQVFNPTMSELISLRTYAFSANNVIDNIFLALGRMYNSPIESIISLSMIPYVPTIGSTKEDIYLGNNQSGVTAYKVTNQFLTVDWGNLDIPKATRTFNDFSPYTKAEIYLPYIGVREIDIDKIVGYNITLQYYIDVVSGDFIASLCVNGAIDAGTPQYESMIDAGMQSGILYQWAGNCALHIPMSASNFTAQTAGMLGLIGAVGGAIMGITSGGAVAPAVAAGLAGGANAIGNLAKNPVEHSGSIPSMSGWLSVQTPYIILSRPRLSIPENNGAFVGYPTNVFYTLSDVSGYTEIEKIHLENIPATATEKTEIETLLKTGVIL